MLGQVEDVIGNSCNSAKYIPTTKYTKKLKKNSSSKEKQTIGAANRFRRNTGKLVGIKAADRAYKKLKKLNKDLSKSAQYE